MTLKEELAKAKVSGGQNSARLLADKLESELRTLEQERSRAADAAKAKSDAEKDLELRLRKLQDERAKAANKFPGSGDRVAELEDRVKQMEKDFQKLLAEVERLRKK